MRLFVDRARDVQPGFTLTSQNAAAVAELCRRLDGLPLALELAAASMRLLTPDQILARLPGQLEHPGAVADLPGRQQTLTSTIQWSYDLLPAPDQQMLARLSVFAAPFTAAAAEAVGGQEDRDAVQDLATLLDNSMVSPADRPDGERAFRLLGPIRRFAAAQLADSGQTISRLERYLLGVLDDASPHYGSQDRDMRRASTASSRTCAPCSPGSLMAGGRQASWCGLWAMSGSGCWSAGTCGSPPRCGSRSSRCWHKILPAAIGWRAPGCWPADG